MNTDALFLRASTEWDKGNLRSAFRLFLSGAKAGDSGAQVNLGHFYHHGVGTKPNRTAALHWYKEAYRRGERCAASNIGLLYSDEENFSQAIAWYKRAVKLKDGDANLAIAKIYLAREGEGHKAISYLEETCRSKAGEDVLDQSRKEAQRLLRRLDKAQTFSAQRISHQTTF